ncbi:MAG: DUF3857 domain-containing protein [Cyclobacteriaceae bacterium]|jgi:hypothetical protein|nr:DUF3857 domain-containing protein [Flammeovirgaceae bacterium]
MKKYSLWIGACILLVGSTWAQGINSNKKRAEEVKALMWANTDKDFQVTQIPDKWKEEQAVILAKSNVLYYRKDAIISNLNYDRFTHVRVKLLSSKAIEEYAQFTLQGGSPMGSNRLNSYAGFKIVKQDGSQVEVPMSEAVKEKETYNGMQQESYKLAIPNLVVGDILDYYIVKEENISLMGAKYYAFDPVLFQLHSEYPIVKQKISFEVLRRCYINLKSLNGAPGFKLTQGEDDRSFYYLEDKDRESVKDLRWFFPYRELPTIKFKVTYASAMMAGQLPFFIGEPGILKSKVDTKEVKDLVSYYYNYITSFGSLSLSHIKNHLNKKFKGVKDTDIIAREAYYALRNYEFADNAEERVLNGYELSSGVNRNLILLSNYYKSKDIPHEFIIGIPREVSPLSDLIFENEMSFMLKVNTPKPFYVGRFDANSIIGEIDTDLQGETVYSGLGTTNPSNWYLQKISIPVVEAKVNRLVTTYSLDFTDLSEGVASVQARKLATGVSRIYYQNILTDFYSYKEEERVKFENKEAKNFEKKFGKKRSEFLAARPEKFKTRLKEAMEGEFDLPMEDISEPTVVQLGRWHDKPEFIFDYNFTLKSLTKRAGPNYLVSVGKLIESQVNIAEEEKERKYNVYLPSARDLEYVVKIKIPAGYKVTGMEKLNTKVENQYGLFNSSATIEGDQLIIQSSKIYKTNYVKKEDWKLLVDFVQAAYEFTNLQVVFEKQ